MNTRKKQVIPASLAASYLHSLLILADEFRGEFAEDLQEGQVDWRELGSAGVLVLEGKLDTVPGEQREDDRVERKRKTSCDEINQSINLTCAAWPQPPWS